MPRNLSRILIVLLTVSFGANNVFADIGLVPKGNIASTRVNLQREIQEAEAQLAYNKAYTREIEKYLAVAMIVNMLLGEAAEKSGYKFGIRGLGLYYSGVQTASYIGIYAITGQKSSLKLAEKEFAKIVAQLPAKYTPTQVDDAAIKAGLTLIEIQEILDLLYD